MRVFRLSKRDLRSRSGSRPSASCRGFATTRASRPSAPVGAPPGAPRWNPRRSLRTMPKRHARSRAPPSFALRAYSAALVTATSLSRHLLTCPGSLPQQALCVRSTQCLASHLSVAALRRITLGWGSTAPLGRSSASLSAGLGPPSHPRRAFGTAAPMESPLFLWGPSPGAPDRPCGPV